MATVSASTLTLSPTSERSYAYFDQATITAEPATGDIWRFFVIPAGTQIYEISVNNATLGTGAPGDVGYLPVDGSTGDADAFLNDFKFSIAHATVAAGDTANDTTGIATRLMLSSPVMVEKDSFLAITFGTINTGASGECTIRVNGKLLGPK